jgi:hypothetical protein
MYVFTQAEWAEFILISVSSRAVMDNLRTDLGKSGNRIF